MKFGANDIFKVKTKENLILMIDSGIAYIKSRISLDLLKCKQSVPYELLSSCRLTATGKRIAFSISGSECERCALLLALI